MQSLLSKVGRVVKLILVVPASNATLERCYSKMKLIRDYVRSTMTQERANHFMVLGIYPKMLDNLNSNEKRNSRREHVFGKEKDFSRSNSFNCKQCHLNLTQNKP